MTKTISFLFLLLPVFLNCFPTQRAKTGTVYVVYCIDTESSGFKYGAYEQNLNLNTFYPGSAIDQTYDSTWRFSLKDSFDCHLKFTYYLMTIEGYRNTRHGVNAVAQVFLKNFQEKVKSFGDEIGWHYHHADWFRDIRTNKIGWNKIETFSDSIYREKPNKEIAMSQFASFVYLNHLYPSTYRAGWIWENTDLSNWLDSLFPSDYSNFWEEVDRNLFLYHPSKEDIFTEGGLSRSIVRSVERDSLHMELLFRQAFDGEDVIFSHYTHNYGYTKNNNSMIRIADLMHKQLQELSTEYGVKFKYCTATEAVNFINEPKCDSLYELNVKIDTNKLVVTVPYHNDVFGTPVIVYKTIDGTINAMFMANHSEKHMWIADLSELSRSNISYIVASVNKCGQIYISNEDSIR